jgi:hypothetical protein
MIVFIGCVKNKKPYGTKACELYDSTFFNKCLRYAESLNPSIIYILSAKYGVVKLDEFIEPYDKTLNSMSKSEQLSWANMVHTQLTELNVNFEDEVVWLCGAKYRQGLIKYFTHNNCPLEGMGIGCQLSFMTKALCDTPYETQRFENSVTLW